MESTISNILNEMNRVNSEFEKIKCEYYKIKKSIEGFNDCMRIEWRCHDGEYKTNSVYLDNEGVQKVLETLENHFLELGKEKKEQLEKLQKSLVYLNE